MATVDLEDPNLQGSLRGKETMNIFVVGNTCTGKSALINKMIGKDVAEEHEEAVYVDEQCGKGTNCSKVYTHSRSVEGVTINYKFWDTPGLQGGTEDDIKCILHMKAEGCDKADLILYCIDMSNTRFQQEDHKTIMNLTENVGEGIWENAIFVLTFANDVVARLERKHKHRPAREKPHEAFKGIVSTWKKVLSNEVRQACISGRVAESGIPVVPAGYETSDKLHLEDDINWIESLWHELESITQKSRHWFTTNLTLVIKRSVQAVSKWFWGVGESVHHKQISSPPSSPAAELRKSPATAKPKTERGSSTMTKQIEER